MGKVGISFAIGGSIAAVIMVIGMITLVADTSTTGTSLNLHGYYTVTVMDSEGNIKSISHGENEPTHLLKDCLFDGFFSTTEGTGTTAKIAVSACNIATTTIAIGDGGEVA